MWPTAEGLQRTSLRRSILCASSRWIAPRSGDRESVQDRGNAEWKIAEREGAAEAGLRNLGLM